MDKKIVNYIIIGLLAVLLALFVGIYLGNIESSTNTNNGNGYTPPAIEDNRGDGVQNPNLGTVEDDENYIGEKYYLNANNSSYKNFDYFINSYDFSDMNYMAEYLIGMFNATYTSDLSSSSFITVGRLEGNQEHSSLVYIKFSTYLGQYNGSELVSTTPALVTFGFEQTINNEYILRYAFCTYGDRGEVYSNVLYLETSSGTINNSIKLRVPYMLTADYSEVAQLFSLSGLTKDGYTYKLLNNESEQYYIESNTLSIVSNLTKYVVGQNLSLENNKTYIYDIDLTNYIKVSSVDYDYVLTTYSYIKNSLVLSEEDPFDFDYFNDNEDFNFGLATVYSIHSWFNNDEAIYNVPLVNIEV